MKRKNIYKTMFDAGLTSDIGVIVEAAYEHFGKPIIVLDTAYNVMAQVPDKPIGDESWDKQWEKKYANADLISVFHSDNYLNMLQTANAPIIVDWGIVAGCPRIAYRIMNGDRLVGTIGILCPDKTYDQKDLDDIVVLAQALGYAFRQKAISASSYNALQETMLSSLLRGNIQTKKELLKWEERSGIKAEGGFAILAAHLVSDNSGLLLFPHIRKNILSLRPDTYPIAIGDTLYVLFTKLPLSKGQTRLIERVMPVYNLVREYEIPLGMSNFFDDLLDLPEYRYQADRAAELGSQFQKKTHPHIYGNLTLQDMFSSIRDNINPESYMHPALEILHETDKAQNTEYLLTLDIYLHNICDSKKTCEKLHMHRNTLVYRLGRIRDLTGIDLADPGQYLHLLSSFYLRKLNKMHG